MAARISVSEAARLIDEEEALVVDIRDPNTFAQGHIGEAWRLDHGNIEEFLSQVDKALPLVVCCYHGNASQGAADYFAAQGFTRSYSMDGGMSEWALTRTVVAEGEGLSQDKPEE